MQSGHGRRALAAVTAAAAGLAHMAAVGFVEELGLRGYVLQNIAEAHPLWAATAATGSSC